MHMIYIAGAYTAPTRTGIMANVQRAREVAARVAAHGAFPVTPHFLGDGIEDAGSPQFWYDGTLALMRRCDAVLVVPGYEESKGTLLEIADAGRRGLPVLYTEAALVRWLASGPDRADALSHAHGQGQEDAVATIAKMLRCPPTIGDIEAALAQRPAIAFPGHCCMLGDPKRTTNPQGCPACEEMRRG